MRTVLLVSIPAVLVLALAACSSDSTSSSSSSQSYKCCVNGVYYNCRTQEEESTCGTSKMTCPVDTSKNDQCK